MEAKLVNKKISSNSLKEQISMILGKSIEIITTNDLASIESIVLKKMDFDDNETDCNIEDLIELKKLNSCTLCDFDLDEKSIENINKIEKLEFIHFDFCNFSTEEICFNSKIEEVYFNMCENVSLKKLQNTKLTSIELIGNPENMQKLDIVELVRADNLRECSIHNYSIKNIEKILEVAPQIEVLNIDGSKVEEERLKNLVNKIKISHEKDFHLGEEPIWD